jgi:hypothetical protein
MPIDRAELSSIASSLQDMSRRVSAMAERASAEREEQTASELFGVERALRGATRLLQRLLGE